MEWDETNMDLLLDGKLMNHLDRCQRRQGG